MIFAVGVIVYLSILAIVFIAVIHSGESTDPISHANDKGE